MIAAVLSLTFIVATADEPKLPEAAQKELKKLEGKWKAVKAITNGLEETPEMGGEEVVVPPGANTPPEATVTSGFAFGGNIELSYALVPLPFGDLNVATWPMFLKGTNGFGVVVPVGIAVRVR